MVKKHSIKETPPRTGNWGSPLLGNQIDPSQKVGGLNHCLPNRISDLTLLLYVYYSSFCVWVLIVWAWPCLPSVNRVCEADNVFLFISIKRIQRKSYLEITIHNKDINRFSTSSWMIELVWTFGLYFLDKGKKHFWLVKRVNWIFVKQ